MGAGMSCQLPFDSKDDLRWKLLEAARARPIAMRTLHVRL